MRVLVCGGRDYADEHRVFNELGRIHRATSISVLIEGGATGSDQLAARWALGAGVPTDMYAADWVHFGKKAGPIRNQRMLDEGKPDLVVAFAGGRGTADMVRRAKAAGVRVLEV
jgi:predicted Rossmann-fold nucleotide-binding protein